MTRVVLHPSNRPIWFDLMTTDAKAARRFYGAALGWSFDTPSPDMGDYAIGRVGDAPASGIGSIPPGQDWPPAWSVYFGVTHAESTIRDIVAAGGKVMSPVEAIGEFGRMAMCEDPTGAVFGLWEPGVHTGAGIIDEPGGMAWCEVNTRDATAAAAFYRSVFNLTGEVMEMQGTPYHTLRQQETPVCGVLQMTAEWGDLPPHWMAYFAVANADDAKAAVEGNGGTIPYGPFDTPYGRVCVVRDPQGAMVSLIELSPA
jgi:uncharacterized protein